VDVLTESQRHRCMAAIRSRDTKPEIRVRSLLRTLGYRYRLHVSGLPGKPDIILCGQQFALFVHGCFWHSHRCPYGRVSPTTNAAFWQKKRRDTVKRDRRNLYALRRQGWTAIVIWECWTRSPDKLSKYLISLLKGLRQNREYQAPSA